MASEPPPPYLEPSQRRENGFTTFSHYVQTTTHIVRKPQIVQEKQNKWPIFQLIYSIFILIALLMVTLGSVSRGLKDIYIVRFDIGYLSLQVPENNTLISPDNSKKSNNSDPIIMDFGTIPDGYEYVSSQELGFHRYYQVGIFNWLQYGFQPTKTTKISILEGIDFPKVLNEDSEARVIVPGLSDRSKLNTTNNVFKLLQPLSIMAVVAFVVWVLSILADASGRFRYVPCGYLSTFLLLCHFIFAICYSIASTKYALKIRSHVTALVLSVPTGLGLLWASFVVQLISAVTHKARNVPFSQLGSTDEPHDHHHVQV